MAGNKFRQGTFVPLHPEKYRGTLPIVYRSSWELRVMRFLDSTPTILQWMSESIVIPYLSPLDGRVHRYFTDFAVTFRTRSGDVKKALIEVKPDSQTRFPESRGKKKERFLQEVETYTVNQAKWEAADKWCKDRGIEFWVLTEYDIGLKKRDG